MSDLYRLVYASKNLLQGTEAEISAAVAQILDASQRNNARVGVTGALMFNAGAFAQVLEGPRKGVEATFERIQRDERHGDVTVLQCGPAEARGFETWSMAFVGQSARGQVLWSRLAMESGFDVTRMDGDAVFAMLHGLVLDEEGAANAGTTLPGVAAIERPRPVEIEPPAAPVVLKAEAPRAPAGQGARPAGAGLEAALGVIRDALARERARTIELLAELDEARIALALSEERCESLRGERDLWAGRARLLATTLSEEAAAVTAESAKDGLAAAA
jgi:blue light- and temperature-responsive anti-repressor